jgi:hypothetical protein
VCSIELCEVTQSLLETGEITDPVELRVGEASQGALAEGRDHPGPIDEVVFGDRPR